MTSIRFAMLALVGVLATPAMAQNSKIGTLSCDVSKGIGMVFVEKQNLSCTFTQDMTGVKEAYVGTIDQLGVTLGVSEKGHLIWGVIAATGGPPPGALAGTYVGVGANASFAVGAGANVLVGGSNRAFSLQPLSVQGQEGVNVAGGFVRLTLRTP